MGKRRSNLVMNRASLVYAGLLLLCVSAPHALASPSHDIAAYISEPAFAAKLDASNAPWAASVTWLCLQHNASVQFSLHVSAFISHLSPPPPQSVGDAVTRMLPQTVLLLMSGTLSL